MTAVNQDGSQQAVVEAALVLPERMGLSPPDLAAVQQPRKPVPTFAEYVPVVSAAASAGTRRAYGSYWNRVVKHWGGRRLDVPPVGDPAADGLRQTHVMRRRNARGGRSAGEHLVAALRCLYRRAALAGGRGTGPPDCAREELDLRGGVFPRVSSAFLPALILDHGSDVAQAHLERQRVILVHSAELVHEHGHVPDRMARQVRHAHEPAGAGLGKAGDRTGLDSVKITHAGLRVRRMFSSRAPQHPACGPTRRACGEGPCVSRPGPQIGRTWSARGPLGPRVTVYSTRWLSWRLR